MIASRKLISAAACERGNLQTNKKFVPFKYTEIDETEKEKQKKKTKPIVLKIEDEI